MFVLMFDLCFHLLQVPVPDEVTDEFAASAVVSGSLHGSGLFNCSVAIPQESNLLSIRGIMYDLISPYLRVVRGEMNVSQAFACMQCTHFKHESLLPSGLLLVQSDSLTRGI